ncbi:MAG TPA: alpha-L-arabinofuranosidase C-terminal domain-containing protein, partial [Herpetosiphonaceae bacterium]|nr:alpha-L-arabinofuranosidase C-terminal domain-containing protein [Herpetosiphonaceae bacterium]
PPVMRWPGGCFADDYHWRDGVGPVKDRPRRINIHWGDVVETNAFGTHEFIRFCRAIGAQPYLAGNLGSGTPQEMRDWVEYCNFPGGTTLSDERTANGDPEPLHVRYWGVGNENWGCGGNFTPDDYATEYRRFATFLRNFGSDELFLVACGPASNDLEWTRRFFTKLFDGQSRRRHIHGYAAHYYCHTRGMATEYDDNGWYQVLAQAQRMEPLVVQQRALMDAFDPERKIGLIIDEWGTWHRPTPGRNPKFLWQQNTLRDALVAALTLDIFNRHADKVVMANIAQTVNVLQALILMENDTMITTPTYHVFDLYQTHQGAQALRTLFDAPEVTYTYTEPGLQAFTPDALLSGSKHSLFGLAGSASLRDRTLTLTVVNPRIGEPIEAEIRLHGDARAKEGRETVLTHADIHALNDFDAPDTVRLSDPRGLQVTGKTFSHTFAPQSVTRVELVLE